MVVALKEQKRNSNKTKPRVKKTLAALNGFLGLSFTVSAIPLNSGFSFTSLLSFFVRDNSCRKLLLSGTNLQLKIDWKKPSRKELLLREEFRSVLLQERCSFLRIRPCPNFTD